ncbi:hypothetical protein [Mycobacterium montefiorense]|nr:hypothetical protein [Mycobacterium montefiorense]
MSLGLPGHLYYAGLSALALVGVVESPIAATSGPVDSQSPGF